MWCNINMFWVLIDHLPLLPFFINFIPLASGLPVGGFFCEVISVYNIIFSCTYIAVTWVLGGRELVGMAELSLKRA